MKKLLLGLIAMSPIFIYGQIITIPNANFKHHLTNVPCVDLNGDGIVDIDVDTNDDGEIQQSEALAVTRLYFNGQGFSDITGIEYFTNIINLQCSSNNLSTLTNISALTNLTYLDCSSNSLTSLDVSGLINLTYLTCHSNQISVLDVSGLLSLDTLVCSINHISVLDVSNLSNLSALNCYANQISALDVSSLINLSYLSVESNQIDSLDVSNLPVLLDLICSDNPMTNLVLSPSIERLKCTSCNLTSLDISSLSHLSRLNCDYNQLSTLNASGLSQLTYLNCTSNNLSSLSVSGDINLVYLYCSINHITSLDLSGLSSLNQIYSNGNALTTLDFTQNPMLTYVSCGANQLVSLFLKNGVGFSIDFDINPNLSFICCDNIILSMIQNRIITYNLLHCRVSTSCSFTPGGDFNTSQASNLLDIDSNGCNGSDAPFNSLAATVTKGSVTQVLIADSTGHFAFPTGAGTYTVTPILTQPNYFTINPTSVQVTIPLQNDTLPSFCIVPNGVNHDLEVTILPINPPRPGYDAIYSIAYKNKGNQNESGNLSFNYEESVLDFVNSSLTPSLQSNGVVSWNFNNLRPYETRTITLTLNANSTNETPPVHFGDTLSFSALINSGQIDETPLDNSMLFNQRFINYNNFNYKVCLEDGHITTDRLDQYMHYVIKFENKNNYIVENVAVEDIIDTNVFDMSSFEVIASSHPLQTRIQHTNDIEFIFNNINLPFDDAHNDGYVAFRIKPLSTLVENDVLKNKAYIYFGYNPTITTIETQTVVVEPLAINDIPQNTNLISIYPNPTQDLLFFQSPLPIDDVEVYDIQGHLLQKERVIGNALNLKNVAVGVYFIKAYIGKTVTHLRVIKV